MRRYPALRTISEVLRVIAFVLAALGALALLTGLAMLAVQETRQTGRDAACTGLGMIIGAVVLLVYAELISVLVDIEGNTRRTGEALSLIAAREAAAVGEASQPPPPTPGAALSPPDTTATAPSVTGEC